MRQAQNTLEDNHLPIRSDVGTRPTTEQKYCIGGKHTRRMIEHTTYAFNVHQKISDVLARCARRYTRRRRGDIEVLGGALSTLASAKNKKASLCTRGGQPNEWQFRFAVARAR